jgi:hypothetical protein
MGIQLRGPPKMPEGLGWVVTSRRIGINQAEPMVKFRVVRIKG